MTLRRRVISVSGRHFRKDLNGLNDWNILNRRNDQIVSAREHTPVLGVACHPSTALRKPVGSGLPRLR